MRYAIEGDPPLGALRAVYTVRLLQSEGEDKDRLTAIWVSGNTGPLLSVSVDMEYTARTRLHCP